MASWLDLFSLLVTIGVFGGTIYGVAYAVKQISESVKTTKENLKNKGFDISNKGVSIKTSGRLGRQDYIDSTQRGMLKAMTATSFNRRTDSIDHLTTPSSPPNNLNSHSSPTPPASSPAIPRPGLVARTDSTHSAKSAGSTEKKKRGLFSRKHST